jgi:hypothetical protein
MLAKQQGQIARHEQTALWPRVKEANLRQDQKAANNLCSRNDRGLGRCENYDELLHERDLLRSLLVKRFCAG